MTVGETTASVAHEALLREWPRLRRWMEADRDGRRLHQQIATAATDWAATGRDDGALLRGARLAAASDWRGEHLAELTATERDYLDTSLTARERDLRGARRTTRRFQVLAGVLVLLLVGAAVATGLAVVPHPAGGRAHRGGDRPRPRRPGARRRPLGLGHRAAAGGRGVPQGPSPDTENGLLSALNSARYLTRYRDDLRPTPTTPSQPGRRHAGRADLLRRPAAVRHGPGSRAACRCCAASSRRASSVSIRPVPCWPTPTPTARTSSTSGRGSRWARLGR